MQRALNNEHFMQLCLTSITGSYSVRCLKEPNELELARLAFCTITDMAKLLEMPLDEQRLTEVMSGKGISADEVLASKDHVEVLKKGVPPLSGNTGGNHVK